MKNQLIIYFFKETGEDKEKSLTISLSDETCYELSYYLQNKKEKELREKLMNLEDTDGKKFEIDLDKVNGFYFCNK